MRIGCLSIGVLFFVICCVRVVCAEESQNVPMETAATVLSLQESLNKALMHSHKRLKKDSSLFQDYSTMHTSLKGLGGGYRRVALLDKEIFPNDSTKELDEEVLWYQIKKYYFALSRYQDLITNHREFHDELKEHTSNVQKLFEKELIPHVDMLAATKNLDEARLKLFLLTSEYKKMFDIFGNMINVSIADDMNVESLPTTVREYRDFYEWAKAHLCKHHIIQGDDMQDVSFRVYSIITGEERRVLEELYDVMEEQYKHLQLTKGILEKAEKILEYHKKRFQHSLSSSGDVYRAAQDMCASYETYINVLFSYHVILLDAEYIYKNIAKQRRNV